MNSDKKDGARGITSDPLLIFSSPQDDVTAFQVDNSIQLFFNERVIAGSGDIVISNGSDTRSAYSGETSRYRQTENSSNLSNPVFYEADTGEGLKFA